MGKVDRRDEQTQFIVEDAEPVETVQMVMVELNPQQAGDMEKLHLLKTILQEHSVDKEKAKMPVIGIIKLKSLGNLFAWVGNFPYKIQE